MIAKTNQTTFQPYKIVNEGRNSLELQPNAGPKTIVFVFRFVPAFLLLMGIFVAITQNKPLYFLIFGGVALLEAFIFSFIKVPGSLFMDAVGFNLETHSVKGKKESYYLWNDVNFIRYRMVLGKNSTSLTYDAMLKSGKKWMILVELPV
ncbi:MAG: hypothetical protein EOO10_10770 [Chitinophagaceae bacterium]|nr:MAG: hypothetical protein EOO10_10770 [Chitinophagaceae bacterium]